MYALRCLSTLILSRLSALQRSSGLLALALLCSGSHANAQQDRAASNHSDMKIRGPMAFIGDSLTTGAVSHPAVQLGRLGIVELLRGKKAPALTLPADIVEAQTQLGLRPIAYDRYPHPRRLGPSPASFTGPLFWVYRHFSHAIALNYLDYEQLSWAYALGRQWDVQGGEVIIAANDGARVSSAYDQVRLLAQLSPEQFPRTVFILFSGNDVCSQTSDLFTSASDYGADLKKALGLLNRIVEEKSGHGSPAAKTVVVLLEPINIMQLIVNPSIQQKSVTIGERSYRCSEVQSPSFASPKPDKNGTSLRDEDRMLLNFNLLPESPSRYCSGIFQPTEVGETNRAAASRHWSEYRSQIQQVAKDSWNLEHLQVIALDAPAKLLLTGKDIAEDCFHLSYNGQFRLAAAVAEALRKVVPHD